MMLILLKLGNLIEIIEVSNVPEKVLKLMICSNEGLLIENG